MCELPSNFGELTKLTRLHLDENQLRALPDGFGGLVSLKLLDLCTYTFLNSRRRNDRERQLGLILLPDTDRNLDSKPNGYIVLYRNCSHCTDSDLDSDPYLDHRSLLYSFLGWISMRGIGIRARVWQRKCAITLDYIARFGYRFQFRLGRKPNGYIVLCRRFHTSQSRIQILLLTANCRNRIESG